MQGPSQWEQEAVSGASLAASEASPPASGYPVLTNQRPSLPGIKQSEARELRSSAMNPFPPQPGPVSAQILCKKKIASKVHGKQQLLKCITITLEAEAFFISFTFSSLSIVSRLVYLTRI